MVLEEAGRAQYCCRHPPDPFPPLVWLQFLLQSKGGKDWQEKRLSYFILPLSVPLSPYYFLSDSANPFLNISNWQSLKLTSPI